MVSIASSKWLTVLAFLSVFAASLASCFAAKASTQLDFDNEAITWDGLVFEAAQRPDELQVEVSLSEVNHENLRTLIDSNWAEDPTVTAGTKVLRMVSVINVLYTGQTYQTDVLFYSGGMSPIQRLRDKYGRAENRKVYLFHPGGVRRLRLEPKGLSEYELSPENWSNITERFFPYNSARAECEILTDPSLLLPIASTAVMKRVSEPITFCVFNKKNIYRVRLLVASEEKMLVNYRQKLGTTEIEVRRKVAVRNVRIKTSAPDSGERSVEPFEFFEMRRNVEISVAADNGLPFRISGEVEGFGRVEFRLKEVSWRPLDN